MNNEFEDWFKELKKVAKSKFGFKRTYDFEKNAWKAYYLEGYSPEQAMAEDLTEL